MTNRCKDERKRGETCCYRDKPELGFQASAVRSAAEGSGAVNVDSVLSKKFQISVDNVPHLEKVYSN